MDNYDGRLRRMVTSGGKWTKEIWFGVVEARSEVGRVAHGCTFDRFATVGLSERRHASHLVTETSVETHVFFFADRRCEKHTPRVRRGQRRRKVKRRKVAESEVGAQCVTRKHALSEKSRGVYKYGKSLGSMRCQMLQSFKLFTSRIHVRPSLDATVPVVVEGNRSQPVEGFCTRKRDESQT